MTDLKRGLTAHEVEESRLKHGSNALTPPPKLPFWRELLSKFDDPTIKILLVCALLSLGVAVFKKVQTGENSFIDGIGILIAVALATLVSFTMERKNEAAFEKLKEAEADSVAVKVTRDGALTTIHVNEVVVGDLVTLSSGDKPPADGVLVQCEGLTIDEAALTGESRPAEKSLNPSGEGATVEANEIRRGTLVLDGQGVFEVTAVGDKTELGKLAQSMAEGAQEETPLKQKLAVLADQISLVGTAAALIVFAIVCARSLVSSSIFAETCQNSAKLFGIGAGSLVAAYFFGHFVLKFGWKSLRNVMSLPVALAIFSISIAVIGLVGSETAAAMALLEQILLAFTVAVTLVVVAVPEGLPMMIAVSLALNANRMLKKNCLIRKQIASETIGSASVICSDKTGTLTENQMTPVWFVLDGREFERDADLSSQPSFGALAQNCAVNRLAALESRDGKLCAIGNPTEASLLRLLAAQNIDPDALRAKENVLHVLPHASTRKRSLAVVTFENHYKVLLKGAPEYVLAQCSDALLNGEKVPLENVRANLESALAKAAGERALRVLAFAEKVLETNNDSPESLVESNGYTFVGLIGIEDPLRAAVPAAMRACQSAGVNVKIVTGDTKHVARAIAIQCGLLDSETASEPGRILTGEELRALPPESLPEAAEKIRILARSYPEDKLRLVGALQKRGEVVAVTGDGVNDAGALKVADVGLSMGSGTEVAKEASDIILVDDNFTSLVEGVRFGRALFENIQRFVLFQLSVNVVALAVACLGPLFGKDLPLTVPQLLWINIIMDTFAALALSTEPPRDSIMQRPPIPRTSSIITANMLRTICFVGLFETACLLFVLVQNPFGMETERGQESVFFTVFVVFQLWHIFNGRALHRGESPFKNLLQNKLFLIIVAVITIVQIVMVQFGGVMGDLFRTEPLPWSVMGLILLGCASVIPVGVLVRHFESR